MRAFLLLFFLLLIERLYSIQIAPMTISQEAIQINQELTVTLELPNGIEVNRDRLRGRLLENGNFLLVDEKYFIKEGVQKFEYTLDPLREGIFPLSFYLVSPEKDIYSPVKTVRVESQDQLNPIFFNHHFLPLTPEIPLALSNPNLALLAELEEKQPLRNVSLYEGKIPPWKTILALSFISLVFWFMRKKIAALFEAAPLTPEEKAERELETIKNLSPEESYSKMIDTMRFFIQEKFFIKAPYLTSEEFLKSCRDFLPEEKQHQLKTILDKADLVKFANDKPSESQVFNLLDFVKRFIFLPH